MTGKIRGFPPCGLGVGFRFLQRTSFPCTHQPAKTNSMKEQVENKTSSPQFIKTDGGKTKTEPIEIPAISLPKGGGAITSIDEKFSVNTANGTASFSVTLPFSQARGITPSVTLSYNSGGGNGIFGLGWSLCIPAIKRKTEKGLPQYMDGTDSDIFLFSGIEDLVPAFSKEADGNFTLDADGNYSIDEKYSADGLYKIRFYLPRIEGAFTRIERWQAKATGEIKWRTISKDNQTTLFGWTTSARIVDPADSNKIFEWLAEFVFDDKGNCAQYTYKSEDEKGFDMSLLHNRNRMTDGKISYTNRYAVKILYGNKTPYKKMGDNFPAENDFLFSTVFDYGDYDMEAPYDRTSDWKFRPDAFSDYKAGFEIRTTRLCQRVLLFHHFTGTDEYDGLVKSFDFSYDTVSSKGLSLLESITITGYIKQANGTYTQKTLPDFAFTYQQHEWNTDVKSIDAADLVHAPSGIDEQLYRFTDLFNEGLSGILSDQANGWYYKSNLGDGQFAQAQLITPKPSFCGLNDKLQLADLDADGSRQLVSFSSEPKGYFELGTEDEWQPFRYFEGLPNIHFNDANARMLDLNGDGRQEILITGENDFIWYPSEGRNGFSAAHKMSRPLDEESGPYLVFANGVQSIFLADMSGDGLTDIVRVRNGDTCYWPNLGYGRFGTKVGMDNAPYFDHPDSFNPSFLRLADIDGSGTTDIIYLGNNKVSCWLNTAGNSFNTSLFEIDAFPAIDNTSKITVADILGNGVACITWSSDLPGNSGSSIKYVDLMGGQKPHIMNSYKNNLGKEVTLQYAASTKFYLQDKLAGQPWITRLHFPVHCVSGIETTDAITGCRFVSSYQYHHGYYDHAEREFRGFGMVEQTDAEYYEDWIEGDAFNIVEAELHQEPVVSKTWFHTGAFMEREKILTQFADDYWYNAMEKKGYNVTHPETILPDAKITVAPELDAAFVDQLSAEEWIEALRACKGIILRSEIFARDALSNDNTDGAKKKELIPYSVATHNCIIELIQPKGNNRHAVFIVKESEAITYQYERNTVDPRISHTLNIKLDKYGNILESASVVYPRLIIDSSIPAEIQEKQGTTCILYTQNQFTNDVTADDIYRLRLASETKTYELKGVESSGTYYIPGDFTDILSSTRSTTAAYEEKEKALIPGKAQQRLIEHIRSTYYNDILSGALPLHELESHAMLFESYQLAYTPGLLADIYGSKTTEALMTEGKFTHSEGDDNWWIRSGTSQFINGTDTLADAQYRFYMPVSYTDPYGAVTKVVYYGNYFQLIQETEDALGNKTSVERFNFRTLSPRRMKDSNGNLSETINDELGHVKAIAVYGKGNEADELTGINEFTDNAETLQASDFFSLTDSAQLITAGKALLQKATAYFVYDVVAYQSTGKPVVVATIVREEHFQKNPDSPVQISFEYSNGLGKLTMKKTQAEPGPAKKVVVADDNTYSVIEEDTSTATPMQLRWIGNGRTVLNNKGMAVKQYEPYFSVTPQYEDVKELVETGVTPMMYYEAMGRLTKTEMPDGTFSTVEFESWQYRISDANDTILLSSWYTNRTNRLIDAELTAQGKDPAFEKIAADKAVAHADSPAVFHFDTLGRAILSIENNRDDTGTDEFYQTITQLDIEGNLCSVTDANGNVVMQYKYDMLGNLVYQNGMDNGQRWLLINILGSPLRTWDERDHEFQYYYDVLHRPTYNKVLGGDGTTPLDHIFDRVIYGEDLLLADRSNETSLQAINVLGKPVKQYDTSGMTTIPGYDFNGQAVSTTKNLFAKYKEVANWTDANLVSDLESEDFTFITENDALGRISKQTAPDNSFIIPGYNERGLLNSESVQHSGDESETAYIKSVAYNEKGLRNKIIYGNDVTANFSFDTQTFRLIRLKTKKINNDPLQDWNYTYDPVGNIIYLNDQAIPETFFDNRKITGASEYTYDALYRLVKATGRENSVAMTFDTSDNFNDTAFTGPFNPGDPMAMRTYTQSYLYDAVGNIKQMKHLASGNNWTRDYAYEAVNNRLQTTQVGAEIYYYGHHSKQGFITDLPHLHEIAWNFKEELIRSISQRRTDGGTPETTYYQYDGKGQRTRKITENSADADITPTRKNERIYISDYETYREYQSDTITLERQTLSLVNQGNRFVMIEIIKQHTDPSPDGSDSIGTRLIRYQLNNHISSAALELDDTAEVISYEEYHPFGTTAFQANNATIKAAAKRYRYTGMERDDETGLGYHSARYYLPWLGRWLNTDRTGIADGLNLYRYVNNSPVVKNDPSGNYEEVVHGALTYHLALAAGFTEQDAAQIALAAAVVDHDPSTDPMKPSNLVSGRTAQYHFPSFSTAISDTQSDIRQGTGMNLNTFGTHLHSLEDVGFAAAPGPHLRRTSDPTTITVTEGYTASFEVAPGIYYSETVIPRIEFTIPTVSSVLFGTSDSQHQYIGFGHPFYITETGDFSYLLNHTADQAYRDPVANTTEMKGVYELLKKAADAHYGKDVASNDTMAAAAIKAVTSADTATEVNAVLNRTTDFSGNSVHAYSWWVDHNSATTIKWKSGDIDSSIEDPPPIPRYINYADGTRLDTQTNKITITHAVP